MHWWAWIAVGAVLLGSELAFIDAQFYLVFVGASALVVGFLELIGLLPLCGCSGPCSAFWPWSRSSSFGGRIYSRLRRNIPGHEARPRWAKPW